MKSRFASARVSIVLYRGEAVKCRHHVADALERMAATPGLKCVAKYTARSVPENRAAVGRHCRRVLADVEFLHYSSGLPMGIPLFMWLADIGIEVERVDIVITLSMVKRLPPPGYFLSIRRRHRVSCCQGAMQMSEEQSDPVGQQSQNPGEYGVVGERCCGIFP